MLAIRQYAFVRGLLLLLILPIGLKPINLIDLDGKSGDFGTILIKADQFNTDYIVSSITEQKIPNSIVFPVKASAYQTNSPLFKRLHSKYLFYSQENLININYSFSVLELNCILLI